MLTGIPWGRNSGDTSLTPGVAHAPGKRIPATEGHPEPDDYFRIVRFAKAVEDEVNGFKGFEKHEIQRYLDKVYDEIGVRFEYK